MCGGRARSCAVVHGRAWSCVVVRGRAWSYVVVRGRARSCVVVRGGRAWSCAVRRARSCAVVRGRARSCVVVRGRAWSSLTAVLPASRPALPCCPLRSQRCRDARKDGHTRGRTTYNTPLNPPGVGWVNFFILLM